MKNGYNFDTTTTTLTISASFAKKASRVGSTEYALILKLRKDFPELEIVEEGKKNGKKKLCYAQMEKFIAMQHNANELKKTFDRIKKLSRVQPMPYLFVKNWFDKQFPYFDNATVDVDGYVVAATPAKEDPAEEAIEITDSEEAMAS